MATPDDKTNNAAPLLLRLALPVVVLGLGWFGFSQLAEEIDREPPPEKEKRTLRTKVEVLETTDYPVVIKTNAVVQPHNVVSLTTEVAGRVNKVSPAFEVGAYFTKGEVLVELDSRDYATAVAIAKSRQQAAVSALELAKLDEGRKLRLIERNAVSRAEVDVAKATREQREADVTLAEAELAQAELNLKRTKVVAPFDGRVQTKTIGLGQMTNANTPLGQIFAIDFAEARLPISARQSQFLTLPEYADDETVAVELRDGINNLSETVWHARVVRTEGVLDESSRDLFAIARIDDPFGKYSDHPPLRIGQPVVASIEGIVLHDVIALPRSAVRQLDQIVLIDQQEQTLSSLTIDSIWTNAEHVIVRSSAIPPGKWLATTPMVYTPEGTKVEIIPDATPSASIADSASGDDTQSVAN